MPTANSATAPSHTNLTEKYERKVAPRGPWRYNRPVMLLIGQKCMSSNESFIGMMTGDPEVTTMGDHTCGSSGNPEIVNLPLEMTVSVPQWIDYLPDGTPLDERGFQPQIPFKPAPGAFEGDRDDLLTAALARLSEAPLPEKPIEGPVFERSTADLPEHSQEREGGSPGSVAAQGGFGHTRKRRLGGRSGQRTSCAVRPADGSAVAQVGLGSRRFCGL